MYKVIKNNEEPVEEITLDKTIYELNDVETPKVLLIARGNGLFFPRPSGGEYVSSIIAGTKFDLYVIDGACNRNNATVRNKTLQQLLNEECTLLLFNNWKEAMNYYYKINKL